MPTTDNTVYRESITHRVGAVLLLLASVCCAADTYLLYFLFLHNYDSGFLFDEAHWMPLTQWLFWPAVKTTPFIMNCTPRDVTPVTYVPMMIIQSIVAWIVLAFLLQRYAARDAAHSERTFSVRQFLRLDAVLVSIALPSYPACIMLSALSAMAPVILVKYNSCLSPGRDWMPIVAGTAIVNVLLTLLTGTAGALVSVIRRSQIRIGKMGVMRGVLTFASKLVICLAVSCACTLAGWHAAPVLRDAYCRHICNELDPLFPALEDYRQKHGSYPKRITDLPQYVSLIEKRGISLCQKDYVDEEHLDLAHVEDADATIYLDDKRYQCNVFIRKETRYSSYTFHVFMRLNDKPGWIRHGIWAYRP